MALELRLQNYLLKNNLSVGICDDRIEVRNRDGNLICRGATAHTAVLKAMWLDTCLCREYKKAGPKRE